MCCQPILVSDTIRLQLCNTTSICHVSLVKQLTVIYFCRTNVLALLSVHASAAIFSAAQAAGGCHIHVMILRDPPV